MPPDLIGPVHLRARCGPGHESVFVGLGAAHGMKFAPTFGRLLADLATTGSTNADIGAFAFDRPALTRPDAHVHWLV
jgi:sarcosine oxidase